MNRERLHIITNKDLLAASVKGLIVEAHFDDTTMSLVDVALAKRDVGLTIATLTDSAARKLHGYTKEELRIQRRKEGPNAASIIGAAQVYGADLPDGELYDNQDAGVEFLNEIVEANTPDFLIAPSLKDDHFDHVAAAEIAKKVARRKIPLYFTDTITGKNVSPTHYVELSRRDVRKRRRAYFANESQVHDLPEGDIFDVFDVLNMPKRRGRDIGVPFAGALVFDANTQHDPIAEILKDSLVK